MLNKHIRILLWLSMTLFSPTILRGQGAPFGSMLGGEITYKFVSRQGKQIKYHFTMHMFRDFYSTLNNFDNTAYIGIFLMTNNGPVLVGDNNSKRAIIYPLTRRTEIAPNPIVCSLHLLNMTVEEAVYEFDATLTDTTLSYMVSYEKCCRNIKAQNMYNIITEATYTVEITPESQHLSNSSPYFKDFPAIEMCVDDPFNFDYSARDTEGDELRYSFQTGFTSPYVQVMSTAPPPYRYAAYREPLYTDIAQLGGNPIVVIDSLTGFIRGTPNRIAPCMVMVCVEEYRNGVLLTRLFREYLFNVVFCQRKVTALISTDSFKGKQFYVSACKDAEVTIGNRSYDRRYVDDFYWEIDLKNNGVQRFTDWNLTTIFRDTGVFKGKLMLNPSGACPDSAFLTVNAGGNIKPDFTATYDTCAVGPVTFKGQYTSAYRAKYITWNFDDGTLTTDTLTTKHQYQTAGIKNVRLFIQDIYGCNATTIKPVNWQPAPSVIVVEPDKFNGCAPAKVFFNNKSKPLDSTYTIRWDFGDNTFSKEISPTHTYLTTGNYNVRLNITSPLGCKKEVYFPNWINIKSSPKANFDYLPLHITNLKPTVSFSDKSINATSWEWSIGLFSTLQQNPTYTFRACLKISQI